MRTFWAKKWKWLEFHVNAVKHCILNIHLPTYGPFPRGRSHTHCTSWTACLIHFIYMYVWVSFSVCPYCCEQLSHSPLSLSLSRSLSLSLSLSLPLPLPLPPLLSWVDIDNQATACLKKRRPCFLGKTYDQAHPPHLLRTSCQWVQTMWRCWKICQNS